MSNVEREPQRQRWGIEAAVFTIDNRPRQSSERIKIMSTGRKIYLLHWSYIIVLIHAEGIDLTESASSSHIVLENPMGRGEKQTKRLVKLRGVKIDSTSMGFGADRSPFSSPYFASAQVAVHKRLVHRRSQVLQFEPLRRGVPSQLLHFRWWVDDVDADDGCVRTPNPNLSLRKTLPKMTLQTSSPYGIYSRLIPPRVIDQPSVSRAVCVGKAAVGRTLGGFLAHVLVVYYIFSPNDSRSGPGAASKLKDPV